MLKQNSICVAVFAALCAGTAHATIDSYMRVLVPAPHAQENGYCMIPVTAFDGASSWESGAALKARILQSPNVIPSFMAISPNTENETFDANALSSSGITFYYEYDTVSSVTINVTSAFRRMSKPDAVIATRLAIYTAVVNGLSSPNDKIKVVLKGLPASQGVNQPVPAQFQSPFSKSSPFLNQLKSQLNMRGSCNN